MVSTLRDITNRLSAGAMLFAAVVLLFFLSGCGRGDASASSAGSNPGNAPAESNGRVEVKGQSPNINVADNSGSGTRGPVGNGSDGSLPLEPNLLETPEPGHDALLAAMNANNGDLAAALDEVSVQIKRSSSGEIILINLTGPYITDAALEQISKLDSLLVLDIWDAPVTDAGIAYLKDMTQLRALGLRNTGVTDDGLAYLSKLSSLKELNLTLTAVTDDGLTHLAGLKSLHKIGLDDTAVTGVGINRLQIDLPLCSVAW